MKKLIVFILSIFFLLLVANTPGKTATPVWIVTEGEAAAPARMKQNANQPETMEQAGLVSASLKKTTGPIIVIEKPKDDKLYSDQIDILIYFKKNPLGEKVNMDSLRITYLKMVDFDITDRLRPFILETMLNAEKIKFPKGEHAFEIKIRDVAEMESSELFSFQMQ